VRAGPRPTFSGSRQTYIGDGSELSGIARGGDAPDKDGATLQSVMINL
jgi:hypothetical protein